jgi:predicted amidohydrolase YtcJ
MKPKYPIIGAVAALALVLLSGSAFAAEPADTVFTGGKVYTVDDDNPWAEAVAVKGNKIVYVGDVEGAKAFIGDDTKVIDLTGKMMLPGYVSTHDHIIAAAWVNQGVNLNSATNKKETLQMIRDYVGANPDLPIVLGQGYNTQYMGGFPTAAELDEIVPDKVAIIIDFTLHNAWLNTKALEAGNITKDTPDPTPGVNYWVRDKDGNPTGVGMEGAWMAPYLAVAWDAEKVIRESRAKLQAEAAAGGMTTVLVPQVVTPNVTNAPGMFKDAETTMKILTEAKQAGELPMRTFVSPSYKDVSADPVEFAKRVREMADRYSGDMVRVQGIKLHPEGTWSGMGVLMLEPFEGTDNYGASVVSPALMKEVVLAANAQGLDVVSHAEGSATVRGMIDAILASREAGNTDERNAIHHYQIVHPDDQQRVIDNHIPVNATPIFSTDWAGQDADYKKLLGEQRTLKYVGQYASPAEADYRMLSISADSPSSPMSNVGMLSQIYGAVTFKSTLQPPEVSKPFPPGAPHLTLEKAIKAVTIGPAWQLRMEDKIGSIKVGKLADFVILDRNIMELKTPEELLETKVLATMVDGQFTFDRATETAKKDIVKVEVTNPALQDAIDIEQLNLLVTDELQGAFNPWCGHLNHPYNRDDRALRFVPADAKAAFSKLPRQGYTFARPARAIHWKKDGQTYWILWTLKDDAAVLWAYDPEVGKAVEILQVRDKS